MNLKGISPRDIAFELLDRSICRVQVAAVISDNYGIVSYGWNHHNFHAKGTHAEAHAISRANRERLKGARITVVARRRKNKVLLLSRPCVSCMKLIGKVGIKTIEYTVKNGWGEETYFSLEEAKKFFIKL